MARNALGKVPRRADWHPTAEACLGASQASFEPLRESPEGGRRRGVGEAVQLFPKQLLWRGSDSLVWGQLLLLSQDGRPGEAWAYFFTFWARDLSEQVRNGRRIHVDRFSARTVDSEPERPLVNTFVESQTIASTSSLFSFNLLKSIDSPTIGLSSIFQSPV